MKRLPSIKQRIQEAYERGRYDERLHLIEQEMKFLKASRKQIKKGSK